MKKKSIAIIVGIVAVLLIAFLTFRPKSFEKEADKVLNSLTSYTLQGEMELNKGEDIKSYLLEINYKKGENDDYFKVSLFDKNLNQEQILLRNKVLTSIPVNPFVPIPNKPPSTDPSSPRLSNLKITHPKKTTNKVYIYLSGPGILSLITKRSSSRNTR